MHAGVETYIASTIPQLAASGHEVAFWFELDDPAERPPIPLSEGALEWCAARDGADRSIRELERWAPDLIFAHSLLDAELHKSIFALAPTVYFAHVLAGACITGAKVVHRPAIEPCSRLFGPACLAHYFPRRCGGLSPITMVREYGRQTRRQRLMLNARAVIVGSNYMRDELLRYGISARCVRPYVPGVGDDAAVAPEGKAPPGDGEPWRLLFLGRMDTLKGGQFLVDAAGHVARVGLRLHVVFAGDGPSRRDWEAQAEAVAKTDDAIRFEFIGWASDDRKEQLFRETHLLVVPSVWPEPFGLVGPEAGQRAVPAAAFAVGGIPEWLADGGNGYLASGTPPTARGLAAAIEQCINDPSRYRELSRRALAASYRYSAEEHVTALNDVFAAAVARHEVGD